jgi:hypothetical protein
LDQLHAGKKLMLITNSEWTYTRPLMEYAVERFLPPGMRWRDLFEVIVVEARKPDFFTGRTPFFEIVSDDGTLRPNVRTLEAGKAYFGGSAYALERMLTVSGDEILYVGDHMFGDVHVSKRVLRWRTALILRELEEEFVALGNFRTDERRLAMGMARKEALEARISEARLSMQRLRVGYGPPLTLGLPSETKDALTALDRRIDALRSELSVLDAELAPLAQRASELMNARWGPLLRAGNDKSHLARQLERYADIYTSRVSNFLHATPFVFLRSARGSLPHDPASIFEPGAIAEDGGAA